FAVSNVLTQIDEIPALGGFAAGSERMVLGDRHDVDQPGAQAFAGSAGGDVVGVAGDPDAVEAVAAGEGENEAAGAFGESSAAGGGVDVVADVAAEHF